MISGRVGGCSKAAPCKRTRPSVSQGPFGFDVMTDWRQSFRTSSHALVNDVVDDWRAISLRVAPLFLIIGFIHQEKFINSQRRLCDLSANRQIERLWLWKVA